MRKLLPVVAALAASPAAFAQSSVTLAGIVKSGVSLTHYSDGQVPKSGGSASSVADGGSQFWLLGTEDLGGGLKAVFKIDTRFRVDDNGNAPTASPLATGNTFVGLTGGWGGVLLGKRDTYYCLGLDGHSSRATAMQASSCGILGFVNGSAFAPTSAVANAGRTSNVIRYDLPNLSGLTGSLSYSTSTAAGGSEGGVGDPGKGRGIALQLLYSSGPLSLGMGAWNAKSEDRTAGAARADQNAYNLAAGYDFGFMTAGVAVDVARINGGTVGAADSENKRTAWSLPLTFRLGTGTLLATYTRAGDVRLNGTTQANTGASLLSLGYDYPLSKRTSIGISYAYLDNKDNAKYGFYTQTIFSGLTSPTAGQDQRQLYLGIRHTF